MKPESFRSGVEVIHKKWIADTLYLSNNHDWIDLYTNAFHGDEIYFELKCRMLGYRTYGNEAWACPEEQIQQYKKAFGDDNVYWMFLLYTIDRRVRYIKNYIKKKILNREVWIIPWNFIYQYPPKENRLGFYRYPKQRDFPKSYATIGINGTAFHYTDGRIHRMLRKAQEGLF